VAATLEDVRSVVDQVELPPDHPGVHDAAYRARRAEVA